MRAVHATVEEYQDCALSDEVEILPHRHGSKVVHAAAAPVPSNLPENTFSSLSYEMCKEALDRSVALLLIVLFFPLLLALTIAVRASSPGPAIFRQTRLTKGGRKFVMYKFRSMTHDAEDISGPKLAEKNDPRVTSLGRVLRFTRLDELPQLWNVVCGDMSLVGPRPERPEIADDLDDFFPEFHRRTSVKAGITGLAQVTSGYASSVNAYRWKLHLDLLYIKRRSFMLDLSILLKTIGVVLSGSGSK